MYLKINFNIENRILPYLCRIRRQKKTAIETKYQSLLLENREEITYVNGEATNADISEQSNGLISILHKGKSYTGILEKIDFANKEVTVSVDGQQFTTAIKEPIDMLLSNMGLDLKAMQKAEPVKAPMPGLVLKVLVTPGQEVNKGDALMILEAMKMENVIKSPATAVVKKVNAIKGQAVEKNTVLIEFA